MKPFNGVDKFKTLCANLNASDIQIERIQKYTDNESPPVPVTQTVPRYDPVVVSVTPRTGLFDIWKRSTNLTTNKCVGVGFTYEQAVEFRKKRLKNVVNQEDKVVIFYDIVAQDNKEEQNPLWNPKDVTKDGGSNTEADRSQTRWLD